MSVDATAVHYESAGSWKPVSLDSPMRMTFEECIRSLKAKGVGYDDMLDCFTLTTSEPMNLVRAVFGIRQGLVSSSEVATVAQQLDEILENRNASKYAIENVREFLRACASHGLGILIE